MADFQYLFYVDSTGAKTCRREEKMSGKHCILFVLTTGSKVAVDSSSFGAASSPAEASVVSFGGSVVAAASCSSLMVMIVVWMMIDAK